MKTDTTDAALQAIKLYDPNKILVRPGHSGRFAFDSIIEFDDDTVVVALRNVSQSGKRFGSFSVPQAVFEREFRIALSHTERHSIAFQVYEHYKFGSPLPEDTPTRLSAAHDLLIRLGVARRRPDGTFEVKG